MESGRLDRRSLTGRYLVACVIALLIALSLSNIAFQARTRLWHPAYRFVPIDRVSLYFLPLAVVVCMIVARRAQRLTAMLVAAGVLIWPWAIWRLVFWRNAARLLIDQPDRFAAIMADRRLAAAAIEILGIVVTAMFVGGLLTSILGSHGNEGLKQHDTHE